MRYIQINYYIIHGLKLYPRHPLFVLLEVAVPSLICVPFFLLDSGFHHPRDDGDSEGRRQVSVQKEPFHNGRVLRGRGHPLCVSPSVFVYTYVRLCMCLCVSIYVFVCVYVCVDVGDEDLV